jgi:hypothetical protein
MSQKQKLILTPSSGIVIDSPNHIESLFLRFQTKGTGIQVSALLSADEAEAVAHALIEAAANARLPNDLEAIRRSAEFSRKHYEKDIAAMEAVATR